MTTYAGPLEIIKNKYNMQFIYCYDIVIWVVLC